jgi:DNA-binding NarL/FixJ family response regulator
MSVKVLIVDDQAAFRAAAREVVTATIGFEVVGEASSGEESIEAVQELQPDLVLMDINLPGIDGIEASVRIRSAHRGTAVLLLSTYDREEFGPRMRAAGAIAFMSKASFEPHSLIAAWKVASVANSKGGKP